MINIPKKIYIKYSDGRGLGVFANEHISKNEVIEDCPLITLPIKKGESSNILLDYRFNYPQGDDFQEQVLGLGYASLYNHSETPNAKWINHPTLKKVFRFVALKEINPQEEILVYYGGNNYWFDGRVDTLSKIV